MRELTHEDPGDVRSERVNPDLRDRIQTYRRGHTVTLRRGRPTTNQEAEADALGRRQLTSTLPHIPVQLPPLTLPWSVQ